MDVFKIISLELNGMKILLNSYSDSASATTILPELEKATIDRDKDSAIYCLDIIIDWYNKNIQKVRSNSFITDSEYDEHERIFNKVKELRKDLEEYKCNNQLIDYESKSSDPLIFLSHSSSDQKYGDALEKFIMSLGINKEQLIYTSHPLHKIPLGENIYEYLRKNISRNIFMIFLWSDDYLDSPACLNEMGAAWLVQCDYMNVFVPNFNYNNPKIGKCAVDNQKMGIDLGRKDSCKQSMLELKDKLMELFDLSIDEKEILYYIDEFIKNI